MLVILPCAGGCAFSYKGYKKFLPGADIYEYPGHWMRYGEPLDDSIEKMVSRLVERITAGSHRDGVYLLGHSMGGLVAWFAAKELLSLGVKVRGIFAAACGAPISKASFLEDIKNDDDIKRLLGRIRQAPAHVLQSKFFNENLLPVIRNDFTIVRNAMAAAEIDYKPVPVPIVCFCGDRDPIVTLSDMKGWSSLSTLDTAFINCRGDHFFPYGNENIGLISNEILKRTHMVA